MEDILESSRSCPYPLSVVHGRGGWGQTRGLAPLAVDHCSVSRAPVSFPTLSFERILPLRP